MRIYNMQVNHIENPLGYDLSQPVFSWKIDGVGMPEEIYKSDYFGRFRV